MGNTFRKPKMSGMSNPARGPAHRIHNPLTDGKKVKELKRQHAATLLQSGLHEPKSPV